MGRNWLIAAAALPAMVAAAAPARTDWPAYGRDAGGQRYSPLRQITPANVGKLHVAWVFHLNPDRGTPSGRFSTSTPLVVGNRMFVGSPYGQVYALDSATGKVEWRYDLPKGDQPSQRGLSYWPGDKGHAPRLVFGTARGQIIALEAADGRPAGGFGADGIVNAKTAEIMNGFPAAPYGFTAPPAIYRNLAIFGSRVQEQPAKGPRGDARAFDIVTGRLVWTFHSVPLPGEFGHDTWTDDGWKDISGVNAWNLITVDEGRGIAYIGFGAPTLDRYGGDHKGANLFSDALVAVDAATGRRLWHFQAVHHDIWDYDLATPPTLLTVRKDGKNIPAVAVINKNALLFLLDRVTGKPIFGVAERPVPGSTIPEEQAFPTQPFPLKPEPLARMQFAMGDLAAGPPSHRAACEALVKADGVVGSTAFQPMPEGPAIVRFPGSAGGPEWGGGSFDADRHLLILSINQMGNVDRLVRGPDGKITSIMKRFRDPATLSPCQKPPWGELVAIDVDRGTVAWRSVLGVTDAFPAGQQQTGRPGNGGPITTAAGLTFVGGTDDRRFRAFDTATGRELWTYRLDYAANSTPLTYLGEDGRQYVATVATGGSFLGSPTGGDSLVAFALPR